MPAPGTTITIDTFIGVEADGIPLNRADIQLGLRRLERVYGALPKVDRGQWRVGNIARYHDRQRDESAWNDDGTRRKPVDKRRCDRCNIEMAPTQTQCDYCDWGYDTAAA
jgi:hypothetical protein